MASADAWRAHHDFRDNVGLTPEASAITVSGRTLSYAGLDRSARAAAARIALLETGDEAPVVALYAHRGLASYAAVLGALMRGCTYVPLNPKFPAERNGIILSRSKAFCVLHRPEDGEAVAAAIAASGSNAIAVPLSDEALATDPGDFAQPRHDAEHAYCLFTSGSTGMPKGVPIRHTNLRAYLDAVDQLADYRADDRVSQNFDLTFDLSVHDMFVTWRAGAHLIVPSLEDLEFPANYVAREGVTCWFSVPTLGQKMKLQGAVEPGTLSNLRLSLFCGEALPVDLARSWAAATGHRVENWYGPTEATISCTAYRFPEDGPDCDDALRLVPIGTAFPGMRVIVADEAGHEVADGIPGELLVSGPQVADGYLEDPEKTAAAFVRRPEGDMVWYRTGDRVVVNEKGQIAFLDRLDNQIKLRGYRIELGEIESHLRSVSGGLNSIVVPLPFGAPTATALAAAVEGLEGSEADLLKAAVADLPDYMHPTSLLSFPQFPRNASGKVDRKAVGALVAERLASPEKNAPRGGDKGGKRRERLIRMARKINPAITRESLETAPTLMDAGLDSLGFIHFTLALEKRFEIELDQEMVSTLSWLSLDDLAKQIGRLRRQKRNPKAGKKPARQQAAKVEPEFHKRALRAVNFLDTFPQVVARSERPLAIFVGSSGFLRAIDAQSIEKVAAEHGVEIRAINAGIGALSVEGVAQLSEFVRDTMNSSGKRLAWAVTELDPMHVSDKPPSGDLDLVNDYLAGKIAIASKETDSGETRWNEETGGTVPGRGKKGKAVTEPDWMKRRNREILDMYEGHGAVDEHAYMVWKRGVEAISSVADHAAIAIHPLNRAGLSDERAEGPVYRDLVSRIVRDTKLPVIDDADFRMDPDDYLDRNHVNWWQGREKLCDQLTRALLERWGF